MKKMNMGFMLLVAVVVVAVVLFVYRYAYPSQPWLEGFADTAPFMSKGEAVGSLIFLNKAYKNKDLSGGAVEADMLTVSSCPAKDTNITKTCYSDMLKKYGLNHESDIPESAANLSVDQVRVTLGVLRAYKGIFGSDISQYEMTTAIANDTICGKNKSSVDGFIKPICYNSLLKTLYKNIAAASASASTSTETETDAETLAPAQSTKDYRVSFFKNLSLIAGYTNLKTDAIETAYDKMKSCGKDDSEYDIDCFHELADKFKINITKEAMNSVGVSTKKKSTAEKTVEDALNLLKDSKATAAEAKKCTVEFGKKPEIVPQTGAATETKPDTTCVTTGDVVKETKTPAVEQGCDFANKMPKINVINLRDYVHKDEIPCWSCKL
jgi:hypothetical protein